MDFPRVGLFVSFCGEVSRRRRLAYRYGAPRELLDKGRRSVVRGRGRLASLRWCQSTSIEVRFRVHIGDQAQQGSVVLRTRDDA